MVENSNPFNREGRIINILQQSTNDFCHVSCKLPNPQWDHGPTESVQMVLSINPDSPSGVIPGLETGVVCQPPPIPKRTVDGRNPAPPEMYITLLKMVILHINWLAGFLFSIVSQHA